MAGAQRRVVALVPVALCFVAGYVDVCAFIALFGTFVAQITGTYVIAGAALVTHDPGIVAKLLAIPVFMVGAAVATVIARVSGDTHPPPLVIALLLEFFLLACFLAGGLAGAASNAPDSAAHLFAAIAGYSAMGVQSALVRIFFVGAPSTNVMTTTTSQIAIDAADVLLARRWSIPGGDAARARLIRTLPFVAAFLVGAAAGALAFAALQWWSVAVAIAIVFASAICAWRSTPPTSPA
jgi:uncharacterized membrane protein YoaK (UPF0700 family)